MSYSRVIPRDFFNEAKLLKCLGQLSLKILDCNLPDGVSITIEENEEPFDIYLSDSGGLSVANYPIKINGTLVSFETTYNSKAQYPLYCYIEDQEIEVFNDNGDFTEDFIKEAKKLK